MKKISLIADIVDSKEISDRDKFQQNLKKKLNKINKNNPNIISPYTITLGDEFQSIYHSFKNILLDVIEIIISVHPVKIRFAIGYDKIDTKISKTTSIGMDGPAFHIARNGINELKKEQISIVQFYGEPFLTNLIPNKSLFLAFATINKWKKNTVLILREIMKGKTVSEFSSEIKISKRSIYKNISTNNIKEFAEFFSAIEEYLLKLEQ